jgi:hypothetical protein
MFSSEVNMKTIELPQEFLDKIVLDELTDYREIMKESIRDYYAQRNPQSFVTEDFDRSVRALAALDIVIAEFTPP